MSELAHESTVHEIGPEAVGRTFPLAIKPGTGMSLQKAGDLRFVFLRIHRAGHVGDSSAGRQHFPRRIKNSLLQLNEFPDLPGRP